MNFKLFFPTCAESKSRQVTIKVAARFKALSLSLPLSRFTESSWFFNLPAPKHETPSWDRVDYVSVVSFFPPWMIRVRWKFPLYLFLVTWRLRCYFLTLGHSPVTWCLQGWRRDEARVCMEDQSCQKEKKKKRKKLVRQVISKCH